METMRFREAVVDDADGIGTLHVNSWQETYSGVLPDALLDGLSAEARSAMWRSVLTDFPASQGAKVFIAEAGSDIVGFGACGDQRDGKLEERGFDGEIGAIYVLKSHQRAGIGIALMRLMAQSLLGRGRKGASLWVLRENQLARAFYERLGGTLIGERVDELSGATVAEIAYGWSDLNALVR